MQKVQERPVQGKVNAKRCSTLRVRQYTDAIHCTRRLFQIVSGERKRERPHKTGLQVNELNKYGMDIAALNETWLAGDKLFERGSGYTFFCNCRHIKERTLESQKDVSLLSNGSAPSTDAIPAKAYNERTTAFTARFHQMFLLTNDWRRRGTNTKTKLKLFSAIEIPMKHEKFQTQRSACAGNEAAFNNVLWKFVA
ncbi:hypothetical protein DPMN_077292 [Dreissena polymorpha]|uniref:Uncharacterized protein n=1 Tax=Dreissena polymorpha TaxID=45954 RepID=A0A9D3YPP9_DREPO|nr:hypothetical protein DPMN_077292 [Dreissena polymorpha]